ncbi:BTB/POZ domain-containing protein 2-like [Venturia canescens]|uniref:BTB/POZ domain-containing protein 2-like n=1 Tax=Venturia canescens TaxID=32260 RepID=UPI001C9C25EB|nr:BTB/POZ domain-containing protein 2-like [Venturia canescens]
MGSPCNWQITKQGIAARGQYVLESGQWSDCQFLVGVPPNQEIVGAHKLILAMSSPVFETMFFGSMPEGNNPIGIPEVQAEAFKALLKFIYTDELVLNQFEIAPDLYYCAKKYMLPELAAKCKIYIQSNLSYERVCKIYEFAEFFEELELKEQCVKLILIETKKILTDTNWADTQGTTVSFIFQQNILAIDSEIELYNALLTWAKAECERKSIPVDQKSLRSVSADLLTKIRFLTLTPKQFADGPGKAELLDKDEAFAIIMNISSVNSGILMPQGFSVEKNQRSHLSPESQMVRPRLCGSIQKGEELYCNRNISPNSICQNGDILDCSMAFKVDTCIKMLGVLVSTQLRSGLLAGNTYNEVLYAYLLDYVGTRVTDTHFSAEATCESTAKIIFNRPADILRNKEYRIEVVFNKPGTYPVGKGDHSVRCDGVNFSFRLGRSLQSVRDSLIRGIIFKK